MQAAFQDLIPANQLLPILLQEGVEPPNEPGLEGILVVQFFLGDAALAFLAIRPSDLWTLQQTPFSAL